MRDRGLPASDCATASDALVLSGRVSVVGKNDFEARIRSSLHQWRLADHYTFIAIDRYDRAPVSLVTGTLGGGNLIERLTNKYIQSYFRYDAMVSELLAQSKRVSILHRSASAAPSDYHRIFFRNQRRAGKGVGCLSS